MGATDSKLQFKNHVFRLFEGSKIPVNDPYWTKFWTQPDSVYDVFMLLTASDIRKTRDTNRQNLENLIVAVCTRLFQLHGNLAFPHPEVAPAKELLNCLRILTRTFPFIYEQRSDREIREWEEKLFWSMDMMSLGEQSPPAQTPEHSESRRSSDNEVPRLRTLGQRLVDTAFDLLFYCGFTVPSCSGNRCKVVHYIWETGVGCTTPLTINHDYISNRVEVLRFLLALSSDVMYNPVTTVASTGSRYVTYMVTRQKKHHSMALLCSLLNTTLKYSSGWKVPYDHVLISDRNRQLVIYSLQFLLVLLAYPIPDPHSTRTSEPPSKHIYRQLLSKIHKSEDFQFIANSLTKFLTQPILVSTSYLPGSQREIQWINELTMLFWEFMLCNKKFKSYIISTAKIYDFIILILYYLYEQRLDISKRGHIRLCAYILQHISSDPALAGLLSKRFEGYSNLPGNMKLSSFNGTYADYFILQIYKTITTSGDNLSFLIRTLLICIYNISPYVVNLSYQAATSMLQMFNGLSAPNFLKTSDYNRSLLRLLLKSMNMMLSCNFRSNKKLMYLMLKNEMSFDELQKFVSRSNDNSETFVASDDAEENDSENNSGKMSAKSKGKLPEKSPLDQDFSDEWVLLDPLVAIMKYVKVESQYQTATDLETKLKSRIIIENIGKLSRVPNISLVPHEPREDEFSPEKFTWNAASLGWYESVLWGCIYQRESQLGPSASLTDATSIVNPVASNVRVWNATNIKLFKLQEVVPTGPSLLRPKGAVDAVADSVVQKFSRLATGGNGQRSGSNMGNRSPHNLATFNSGQSPNRPSSGSG